MLDPYGNPIMFLREKRTAVHPYPQRAMMFTGYYRPVRRSNHGGQATGVFAQGNAVSGEAFFAGMQPPHLNNGPEPIEESEVSSAEAQAAPEVDEGYNEDEQHQVQREEDYQRNEHPQQDERRPQDEANHPQGDDRHHEEDEQHQHKQQSVPQEQPEPEPAPAVFTTEAAAVTPAAEPVITEASQPSRPKQHGKKTKKTPVVVVDDDEEDDEDEDDDDVPSVPFIPFKGSRRRQNYPNLNNFFPMVFSFPGGSSRSGSTGGSPPGAVTAIANSYSTGKGGVASSVATAYGGSPNGKKRRTPVAEE
ncbi:RNA polymerase II degradation factor 1 [Apis florea]|uniref:RNA polymerase II degradation factor 1 n=1 Tax=Apis florea TaxID=7463 RepID=UPI00062953C4|nr:RNA polymerase II degradation factor 1 [Apis florea]